MHDREMTDVKTPLAIRLDRADPSPAGRSVVTGCALYTAAYGGI